ncbi:MAG: hypothetical protein ACRBCT_09130 [Alphaproteobacteria bacterium]
MSTKEGVRGGKGGELVADFGEKADVHPAESAGWALVGGASPTEYAAAIRATQERIALEVA